METEKKQHEKSEEELAAYEKLRLRVSRRFGEINEKLGRETISQAIDRAMDEMKEMGEHSGETISRAAAALKKDIVSTTENIRPKIARVTMPAREQFEYWMGKGGALWQEIAHEAAYIRELSRDKSGAFFLHITRALQEWSGNMTEKLGTTLKYKSGEMTHGGEFTCSVCEAKIHLKKPGRIPPCPKCSNSEFHRS
jgi:hypothetical protein